MAPRAPTSASVRLPSAPASAARVSACRARPSTVYGDEVVTFELEGPAAESTAAVEVRDEAGKVVARDAVKVPGTWAARELGSGDFSLHVVASNVTCIVTVNRELSRARPSPR